MAIIKNRISFVLDSVQNGLNSPRPLLKKTHQIYYIDYIFVQRTSSPIHICIKVMARLRKKIVKKIRPCPFQLNWTYSDKEIFESQINDPKYTRNQIKVFCDLKIIWGFCNKKLRFWGSLIYEAKNFCQNRSDRPHRFQY